VPVATGTVWSGKPGEKVRDDNLPSDLKGVNMVLSLLEQSSQPVAITVVGSSQDIAIAGKKAPKLFAEKCAGIYLLGGVGNSNPKEQFAQHGEIDWNVRLQPGAFAAIFETAVPHLLDAILYGAPLESHWGGRVLHMVGLFQRQGRAGAPVAAHAGLFCLCAEQTVRDNVVTVPA
jgi:hypothetical protein